MLKKEVDLFYQHPQYGFDFRKQCLDNLEVLIGHCYDKNPHLEQSYSAIYMALVHFFVSDDETYCLDTPSSPSTKRSSLECVISCTDRLRAL